MNAPRPDDVGKNWDKENTQPFCTIGDPTSLRAIVPVPPSDYHLLQSDMADGRALAVSIRAGSRNEHLSGSDQRIAGLRRQGPAPAPDASRRRPSGR